MVVRHWILEDQRWWSMRDENTEEGPSSPPGEKARGQHRESTRASPEGSQGWGKELSVWMTEPQRLQCPWLMTPRTDGQAYEGPPGPRAQGLCWEVPVPTSRLPGHQPPCRGAHPAGAAASCPPVSDGNNEAPGMQKSRKKCPTEMRSTHQSSKLTQNKDAKKDVIIAFHMLRKVSRNMEDILKTEIKLLKITTQCEITHWMALMAD